MRCRLAAVIALAVLAVACDNDDRGAGGGNATDPTGTEGRLCL